MLAVSIILTTFASYFPWVNSRDVLFHLHLVPYLLPHLPLMKYIKNKIYLQKSLSCYQKYIKLCYNKCVTN